MSRFFAADEQQIIAERHRTNLEWFVAVVLLRLHMLLHGLFCPPMFRNNIFDSLLLSKPTMDALVLILYQVVDSGLDESSCFFAHDADGDHVQHGYYYDEWGIAFDVSSLTDDFTDEETDDDNSTPRPSRESALSSGGKGRRRLTSSTATDDLFETVFAGGDFSVYPDRRKVRWGHVQRWLAISCRVMGWRATPLSHW